MEVSGGCLVNSVVFILVEGVGADDEGLALDGFDSTGAGGGIGGGVNKGVDGGSTAPLLFKLVDDLGMYSGRVECTYGKR